MNNQLYVWDIQKDVYNNMDNVAAPANKASEVGQEIIENTGYVSIY